MPLIANGESGSSVRNKLNGELDGRYSITRYGAVGDDSTSNTAAIQAAIDACEADGGGIVIVPVGIFRTGLLTFPRKVSIVGVNRIFSVLKATAAGKLLHHLGVEPLNTVVDFDVIEGPAVENLTLHGNGGTGTIGLCMESTHRPRVVNVRAYYFSDAGVEVKAVVGALLDGVNAIENATGIRIVDAYSAAYGGNFPTNIPTIANSYVMSNTYRGIDFTGGSGLRIRDCDIESNGTIGNAAAGGIYVAPTWGQSSLGLMMSGTWVEANVGGFELKLANVSVRNVHSIQDCNFINNGATAATHDIYVGGGGSAVNEAHFDRVICDSDFSPNDIYSDAANAEIHANWCRATISAFGPAFQTPYASGVKVHDWSEMAALRMPNRTTTQRNALTPLSGMLIFNTTTSQFEGFNGTSWTAIGSAGLGYDITSDLLAHYALDSASGTTAVDATGNGHTGTLQAAASWIAGHINNALDFNGTSQYVVCDAPAAFDASPVLTVAGWIYQASLATDKGVIAKWDYNTQGCFALQTASLANNKLSLFIATSTTDDGSGCRVDTTNAVLTAGVWTHFAVVFDGTQVGSNRVKIYINGTSVPLTQASGSIPAALTTSTSTLKLGQFGGALDRKWNGSEDDFRIYVRALSAADVTALAGM